jgi:hypothetical protein
MTRFERVSVSVATALLALVLALPTPLRADPASCQKAIARQLTRYKKVYLKAHYRCLRLDNVGRIDGPCPDAVALLKIQTINAKVVAALADACTMPDLAALGFPNDCNFEPAVAGIEAQCAALPVTTPDEFAECLKCWKGAELSEFVAILFASHANEVCGGSVDETSPRCSELDCTTPFPAQHDLGNSAANDCQIGIGRGGIRYLLKREKTLESCALAGGTRASCLADPAVQVKLTRAEDAKAALIMRRCGNRMPTADPPFCCRTGTANECTVQATRDDCVGSGGTVQEGKTCNGTSLNCDPVGGPNQPFTWWENCPESATCPGSALTDAQDVTDCVDATADVIVDELLCFQFPRNGGADWPCPIDSPSGAFLDTVDPSLF